MKRGGMPIVVERLIATTPISRRHLLAIIADEESNEVRLTTRGELASRLRAGDLDELAHEAEVRRVPPGGLLVLFLGGNTKFVVVGGERPRQPGVPRGTVRPMMSKGRQR